MDELHLTFFSGVASHVQDIINGKQEEFKPYYDGAAFQEAIFYSGGALYDEEYVYYIKKRYEEDSQWLKDNKGYDKDEFCDHTFYCKCASFGNCQARQAYSSD